MYKKLLMNFALIAPLTLTAGIAPEPEEDFVSHKEAKQLEDRIKALEEYNNDLQNQLKQNGNNIEKLAVEQIKQNALDFVTQSVTAKILHNINVPQLQEQIIYTVGQQIRPHVNETLINSFDSKAVTKQIVTMVSDQVTQHVKNEFQIRAIDKLTNDLRESVYQKTIQYIVDNFDTEETKSAIMQKISMANIETRAVEQIKQNGLDYVRQDATAKILHNINVPQLQEQIIYTVGQQIRPHVNETLINSFDSKAVTKQIVTMVSDQVTQHVKNEFQIRAIDKLTNDLREPVYQRTIQDIVDNFDTERAISTIMQKISIDIIYQLKAQFSKDAVQQLTTELKASVHKQAQKEIVHSTNVAELKDELYVKFTNEYIPRLRDELDIKAHAKNLLSAQKVYGQVLAARYADGNNEYTQRAFSLLLDGCGSWDKMTLEKLHSTPCEIAIATAKALLKHQSNEKKS